jgi:hypothetical protein
MIKRSKMLFDTEGLQMMAVKFISMATVCYVFLPQGFQKFVLYKMDFLKMAHARGSKSVTIPHKLGLNDTTIQ